MNFIVDLIIIGGLGFLAIWLIREVPGQSKGAALAKSLISWVLIFIILVYYFSRPEKPDTYTLTCNKCGESFVADSPNVNKICSDCSSAFVDEQVQRVLEEEFADFDGEYFRTVTCSLCGKKYLEDKLLNTQPEGAAKVCYDCSKTSSYLTEENIERSRREFENNLKNGFGN